MAEIKLTKSQQAVVNDRGGALLVSAAAGSGKTKVLVDRLLSRICDSEKPCNIDDFLVITYTNAAAAELRLKIAQALSKRLAEEPANRHLQQQMRRIYFAEISTVHAFCANLLRSYAHILDIPGDFRMIEETEAQIIQSRVLNDLIECGYGEGSEDFRTMVETFGYGRDDRRLPEAVLMANKAMRCRADMKRWTEQTLFALDISRYESVMQTPWGQYILQEYKEFLRTQVQRLKDALLQMQYYPNILKGYGTVFEENIAQLEDLLKLETWDEFYSNQIENFGRLKAVREPEDPSVKERLGALRKKCWSDLKKWQQLFYAGSKELMEDLACVMPGTQALIRFAAQFDEVYGEEKKKRKLLDFSDLEHLAIRLLTDRYTGKPTAIAREVSARYEEIMVDEYQDSNQVQEVIFEAISRDGKNRFMVGDVKQSIYRFRLADPTLFLKKYESYPDYSQAQNGEPRKILLSENFRSRYEILSACNDVFGLIMRKQVGDLEYGEEEALRSGRQFPAVDRCAVELHCLTNSDPENTPDKREQEAAFVARRIRQLIDEKTMITDGEQLRPVRPGDIVILMRAVSGNAQYYIRALEQLGIPAFCNQGGDLLETTEVQVLLSLLQIIDNPHQDVPLLTVLASPVFGISLDELAMVRAAYRTGDCYSAICQAGEVFADFIRELKGFREDSMWLSVHDLVNKVLTETGLLTVFSAMEDGAQRERNIQAFCSFVLGFEENGTRSLQQLLEYISNLQQTGGQLPAPGVQSENAVSIMTIHKSKGLEFPIVFLSDLSHSFNTKDMQEAILVDDELAVGCNRIDTKRFVRYPTIAKKSIERKKKKENVSEELRVLYVAMTRPKDMLIMTYYSKRFLSELSSINSQLTMPISDDLCADVDNPGKWILMAALCRTEAGELLNLVEGNDVASVHETPWRIRFHDLYSGQEEECAEKAADQETSVQVFEDPDYIWYEYPYGDVCNIPTRLTATQLKGRLLDREVSEGSVEYHQKPSYQFRKASFMPHAMTAAEKGTATHLFVQYASYKSCLTQDDVRKELKRLVDAQFLTKDQAEAVQIERIVVFFNSELGRWLLSCGNVIREFKFALMEDAKEYFREASEEQILLKGVVDCFVVEDDGITILDFKTDHVSGNLAARIEYYRPQIETYAKALSRIYKLPIKRKLLYFFSADTAAEL